MADVFGVPGNMLGTDPLYEAYMTTLEQVLFGRVFENGETRRICRAAFVVVLAEHEKIFLHLIPERVLKELHSFIPSEYTPDFKCEFDEHSLEKHSQAAIVRSWKYDTN